MQNCRSGDPLLTVQSCYGAQESAKKSTWFTAARMLARKKVDDVSFETSRRRLAKRRRWRDAAHRARRQQATQERGQPGRVGVQTAEERAEANRQRAEQEGDVLEVDDDASDAPPPLGYVCVLKSDGADGERVPLHATLKFGRALDNDVRVPVARCSRLHAELTVDGRATLQNHARAANTTVLRGETLEPKEARDVNSGDVFEICGRRFRFEAAVAPAPAPAPSPQQAVDVDLTGAPDSDDEEEPEFSAAGIGPTGLGRRLRGGVRRVRGGGGVRRRLARNDVCYRCGGRGHWASDCGEPRPLRGAEGTEDVERSWSSKLLCRSYPPAAPGVLRHGEARALLRRSITYMADGSSVMRRDSYFFVAAFSFSFMNA